MSIEVLQTFRFPVVAALPGSPAKGDTVVLNGDGHLYTYSGSGWVDNGAAGAGSGASGKTTVDFGAAPGTSQATRTITGQGAIGTGSIVQAWVQADATADHTVDEHHVENLKVTAGNIVAGTGFDIVVECDSNTIGEWSIAWRWE